MNYPCKLMYIQAVFLQRNCDPFGNGPSVSLARSLHHSILHKRRKKTLEHQRYSHHNTQPSPVPGRWPIGPDKEARLLECGPGTRGNIRSSCLRTPIHVPEDRQPHTIGKRKEKSLCNSGGQNKTKKKEKTV